ncbi:hypothetical protein BABINDRAFT_166632 [Babjeviella inositovora NRRL Y-12698]|uniref:Uncharacterized protein n=1 Tax=Babjeviella inositovora NRRL Y-12698 TaxID=984486 RepID=A0A1E3QRF0_9ASCO|nr:uncharacterized protein BABINDRAFT_166632 [Babjeviella inositovora NRRL Y-12698]ODQ80283.1 hypothetical protein BABINDRAFT_166632 [Babjeviella inositovora NRRL Y-12698]
MSPQSRAKSHEGRIIPLEESAGSLADLDLVVVPSQITVADNDGMLLPIDEELSARSSASDLQQPMDLAVPLEEAPSKFPYLLALLDSGNIVLQVVYAAIRYYAKHNASPIARRLDDDLGFGTFGKRFNILLGVLRLVVLRRVVRKLVLIFRSVLGLTKELAELEGKATVPSNDAFDKIISRKIHLRISKLDWGVVRLTIELAAVAYDFYYQNLASGTSMLTQRAGVALLSCGLSGARVTRKLRKGRMYDYL